MLPLARGRETLPAQPSRAGEREQVLGQLEKGSQGPEGQVSADIPGAGPEAEDSCDGRYRP